MEKQHGELEAYEIVSQSALIVRCLSPGLGGLVALVVFMPLGCFQLLVESETCPPQVANLWLRSLALHFSPSGSLVPAAKKRLTGSSYTPGAVLGVHESQLQLLINETKARGRGGSSLACLS